ncbi:MAG: DUF983 domain-containing protein [Alphaproteobacteria bacterium]|nr:DUF983 domain-containing protein [Alphaproteobacteria bacterium]
MSADPAAPQPAEPDHPPVAIAAAAFGCRCPRCGKGKLFQGLLKVRPACAVCGLDLGQHDAGDGPAVFAILILGAIMVIGVFIVEFRYQPPFWVHALVWPALLLPSTILLMRVLKAGLVALQYRHRRSEMLGEG